MRHGDASPVSHLVRLCAAMFLGMTLWFSATAATGPIVAELRLDAAAAAWLTMAVQAGFVGGTLVAAMLNLPDIVSPRLLFAVGCTAGAALNAAIARAHDPSLVMALRLGTGVTLAFVYPTGMKIAAGWFETRRGAALGFLIGALTIGSAFPHLLAALSAAVPWRTLMLASSSMAVGGGAIVLLTVGDGPYVTRSARFEPAAAFRVFTDPPARRSTLGYLGHMWELYAVWTWIATFATASLHGGADATLAASSGGSAIAFAAIAAGALGSAGAGMVADRVGKGRIARWAMLASGTCAALSGLFFAAPPAVLVAIALIWGVAVVADSAQLSALVAEYSPRDHVGTALTVQTCAGFLLTMLSIRLVPEIAAAVGWRWAFVCLAPGPFLGALALRHLDD